MKQFFCTETDELINFGEVLHLTFCKDLEDGKVTVERDVEFNENTADVLISMGFVEERENREDEEINNDILDFENTPCEILENLIEDFETLEERVDKLETIHEDYVNLTHEMLDTFKEFVLSLPDREGKKTTQAKKK